MHSERSRTHARGAPAPGDVTGIVLCGGASSRMGDDKARIDLGGRSLLERAVDLLDGVAGRVLLACGREPRYGDLGRELVLDRVADGGPLAGLDAGLEAARSEWALALACDMPRLDQDLLRRLLERAQSDDLDLCLPRGARGLEPLCAVYRRTCLPSVSAALAAGERRMVAFWSGPWAEARPSLRVAAVDLTDAAGRADPTINLNSPHDLAEERRHRAGERT